MEILRVISFMTVLQPPIQTSAPNTQYHTRIREMPSEERPRERLIQYGADVLSLSELLAILLRTGTEQRSAVALADYLLAQFDGIRGVSRASIEELGKIHGIGPAKAAQIKAAIEFGRRLVASDPQERPKIRSPRDVYDLLGPSLRDEGREHFIALLLDTKNGVLRQKTVSVGDLSSAVVHPREVFLEAVRHSAASMIVAHNHPSGDPTPSSEDIAVTRRLQEAGELLGIAILDHIIIGDGRFISLKEQGLF
jgi:DNA repair protein RadC